MMILVGVTVNVALNGGLFSTTKEAVSRTIEEKERELIQEGYSHYIMQGYTKLETDDFDDLEEFFLGSEKKGVNIDTLIDEESSINGTVCFLDENRGINITIKEEEDIEFSIDEKDMYIYFEYNNYKYKLITNNESGMTLGLEVIPKLRVQDAVVKDKVDGWNIVFNSTGNTYDLLEDGRIMDKWWELTEEEKEQMKDDNLGSGLLLIAENDNVRIGLGTLDRNESEYSGVVITIKGDNNKTLIYYFTLTEKMSEFIEETSNPKIVAKVFEWYKVDEGDANFKEYKDVSPISIGDFTDEQIYCKSYLEKIINSFNK